MDNTFFISSALILAAAPASAAKPVRPAAPQAGKKPNVILILVDDLGKEWIQQYGAENIRLPRLQRFADEGVVFTRAYSMPQSTPSRAVIMTGQYPYHNGWVNHYDVPRWGHGAQYDWTCNSCFPLMLKERGYRTCVAGKWQLNDFRLQPEALREMGFDEYFMWTGAEGGGDLDVSGRRYWDPYIHSKEGSRQYKGDFGPALYNDFVTDFIAEHREEPFYIYYPMALTHGPFTTTPLSMDARTPAELHSGMVRYMDHLVGRVMDCLEENGLLDRTYVIFTTDNGTAGTCVNRRNGQYVKGGKTLLSENGINCPFMVHVPGLKKGFVTEALIDFTDIAPTVLDMTGSRRDPRYRLDGQSFLPVLHGRRQRAEDRYAVSTGSLPAVLDSGDFVKNTRRFRDRVIIGPVYKVYLTCDRKIDRVYRIVEDPFERHNVADTEKEAALKEAGVILDSFPEEDGRPRYRKLPHEASWDIPAEELAAASRKAHAKYRNCSPVAGEQDYLAFRNKRLSARDSAGIGPSCRKEEEAGPSRRKSAEILPSRPKSAEVLPSRSKESGIGPEEYIDTCIAPIGPEERAGLDAIRGKWKRPLYRRPGGGYEADWEEIAGYGVPEWINDAKFGIYTHWGVYSVPACLGNTYVRNMYTPTGRDGAEVEINRKTYDYHRKNFGDPVKFGYTDFIPLFKAEKFSGEAYVKLMQETGARFGGLCVVHHDGFLMWDSKVNRWNAGNMGPERDLYGEFVAAARKAGLPVLASFHHARTWKFAEGFIDKDFYTGKRKPDIYDKRNADFFWGMTGSRKYDVEEFARQWRDKIREVIDKYEPDALFFDGIDRTQKNSPEKYLVEALKHYFKSLTEKGRRPVLFNKLPGSGAASQNWCRFNFPEHAGIPCYEGCRNMPPDVGGIWMADRAISYPWSYTHDKVYRLKADTHIRALVDHVARGGIYLLSLTPMASGEIDPRELEICRGIGEWLKVNGEAIYATRRWRIPAEGPLEYWRLVEKREGIMWDFSRPCQDGAIRFTRSKDGNTVYAILMYWPEDRHAVIRSMKRESEYLGGAAIRSVEMIGADGRLDWEQTDQGLVVALPERKPCRYAYALRIKLAPR